MNLRRYLQITLTTAFVAGCTLPIGLFFVAKPFGASATLSQLTERQARAAEIVILPFDLRYNGPFKLGRIGQEHPDVLVISSSRAGTLGAAMFKPYRFYNTSFTAWTTEQLTDIFERATRNAPPSIVILSIDYFLFTDDWERSYGGTRTMIFDRPWTYLKSSVLDFARNAVRHPKIFRDYLKAPTFFIGTQAIISEEGFRSDGSYVYSQEHINDARMHNQIAESLVNAMPGAPNMSERQKAPIVRLAELAKKRGVKLIGIQLPFIRPGVDYLDQKESYRYYSGVWREFESDQTRDWLKSLDITFFDFGRSTIDDDSRNFIDAYHTSQLGSLRVMQQLLTLPEFRAIFPALDPAEIERQLEQSGTQ
jgi:hypothetical protein